MARVILETDDPSGTVELGQRTVVRLCIMKYGQTDVKTLPSTPIRLLRRTTQTDLPDG